MFTIIYVDPFGNYDIIAGSDSTEIRSAFEYIESSGKEVITIYDYDHGVQIYRGINYNYHRISLIQFLKKNLQKQPKFLRDINSEKSSIYQEN